MKRGFTLIELMAVIVVLGVVATIAVISVDKIIKDNKEKTYEAQIATIEDAARTWGVKHIKELPNNEGEAISVPLLYFKNEGIVATDIKNPKTNKPFNDDLYVDISYEGGIYKYEVVEESGLGIDTNPTLLNGKYEELKSSNTKTYENGEEVYFNVTSGTKCTSSEAVSTTGTKSGCMKFYAFNDDGGSTVNLLLDHNTTGSFAWISQTDYISAGGTKSDYGTYGKSDKGPLTLLTQLKTDTASWAGTETPSNYTMAQTGQTSNANYTIDYSSYKARLITAQEIATITGNTSWDEKVAAESDWYYFDSKTSTASTTCTSGNTTGCSYGWLYDRTNTNCTSFGCLNNEDSATTGYGYWTASSLASRSEYAWLVFLNGTVNSNAISGFGFTVGVRPVIEVLKSKL